MDMRKAFDGLLGMLKGVLAENSLSGNVFVFVNRRKTYLQALYWDRTGFCLFAKRLEQGRFRFPQAVGAERRVDAASRVVQASTLGPQV
jgi:transposase